MKILLKIFILFFVSLSFCSCKKNPNDLEIIEPKAQKDINQSQQTAYQAYQIALDNLEKNQAGSYNTDSINQFNDLHVISRLSGYEGNGELNHYGRTSFLQEDLDYWKKWFNDNHTQLNYRYDRSVDFDKTKRVSIELLTDIDISQVYFEVNSRPCTIVEDSNRNLYINLPYSDCLDDKFYLHYRDRSYSFIRELATLEKILFDFHPEDKAACLMTVGYNGSLHTGVQSYCLEEKCVDVLYLISNLKEALPYEKMIKLNDKNCD